MIKFLSVPCIMWSQAGVRLQMFIFSLEICTFIISIFTAKLCVWHTLCVECVGYINVSNYLLFSLYKFRQTHFICIQWFCVSAFDRETNRNQPDTTQHNIQCRVVNYVYALVTVQQVCIHANKTMRPVATKTVEIAHFSLWWLKTLCFVNKMDLLLPNRKNAD